MSRRPAIDVRAIPVRPPWLATAPKTPRNGWHTQQQDVPTGSAVLLLPYNVFRTRAQIVNVGPFSVVVAESRELAERGEGLEISAGAVPFDYSPAGYLWGIARPTDTLATTPGADVPLAWGLGSRDVLVYSSDVATARVTIAEEVLA